ncbi:MAG: DUF6478 family protein [Pseudomonadota bacterium]
MAPLPHPPAGCAWAPDTVWAWRPAFWDAPGVVPVRHPASGEEVAPGLKAFHDGAEGSLELGPGEPAGLRLTTGRASGTYASLVCDLPDAAARACTARSVVRLCAAARYDGADRIFGRINLRHGPNTVSQTRPAEVAGERLLAEFDLAYCALGHGDAEQIWVDLLIGEPGPATLHLTDLALSARHRLEF